MHRSLFIWLGELYALPAFPPGVARNARNAKQTEFTGGFLAALTLMVSCWLGSAFPAQGAQQVLKGHHVPKITKQIAPAGRHDSTMHLDVAIGLPLRNHDKLTSLLQELYQPSHANFRHFLTPDQFASCFGPSPEDYQSVIDFAKSHGLTRWQKEPMPTARCWMSADRSPILKTPFTSTCMSINSSRGRGAVKALFMRPMLEPSLDLATPVLAISGLDNYVRPRTQIHPMVRTLGGGQGGGGGGGGGSGSGGSYLGSDFRSAYVPGVSLDGTGQSVALFELTGYDPDDISDYESEAGLPDVPLQNILIDDFDGDDSNMDYAVEATADIEMAISMAPGLSSVLVYEGPTPLYDAPLGTNAIQYPDTTAQINDVFNRIATDDLANQISSSYQMDINLSTVQIFEQFAAQGQSFFQGSGDFRGVCRGGG